MPPTAASSFESSAKVTACLIFYRTADDPGPKPSFYVHSETADPEGLRTILTDANGEIGRVRKHRTVFRIGQTRVYLDQMDGLGEFLEVEVSVDDTLEYDAAVLEANRLLAVLGIEDSAHVEGAYVDLLAAGSATPLRP
ncbi:class IV adenylate cyclase [Arthrobacter sp. R1-13]